MIILLNFAHPLSPEQLRQLSGIIGDEPQVREIATQADRQRPVADVAHELAEAAGMKSQEWQTFGIILNPPGLAVLSLALLAEIHGRCGYFPPVLNIRPLAGAVPPRFEIFEVVNLQALRDDARGRRAADVQ